MISFNPSQPAPRFGMASNKPASAIRNPDDIGERFPKKEAKKSVPHFGMGHKDKDSLFVRLVAAIFGDGIDVVPGGSVPSRPKSYNPNHWAYDKSLKDS